MDLSIIEDAFNNIDPKRDVIMKQLIEAVEFGYWLVNQEHKYSRNYSKSAVNNYYKFFLEEKAKGEPYDFEKVNHKYKYNG